MNKHSTRFFILLLLFCHYCGSVLVTVQPRRISVAISGGASKGAYEAGLNWGLIKLMREAHKIDAKLIGQLNVMEATSFSGASASGINTLLSGLGWCSLPESEDGLSNSIDSNIFRDV